MRKRTKILIVALIAVPLLSYLNWQPKDDVNNHPSEQALSSADYYFESANIKRFDASGKIQSQLSAKNIQHYRTSEESKMIEPNILFFSDDRSQWTVSALTGTLDHQTQSLKLNGDMTMQQPSASYLRKIISQSLTVNLNTMLASTDQPVVIFNNTSQTTADALTVNFKQENVQLKGTVETRGPIND